jgi:hypothetical protein
MIGGEGWGEGSYWCQGKYGTPNVIPEVCSSVLLLDFPPQIQCKRKGNFDLGHNVVRKPSESPLKSYHWQRPEPLNVCY